MKISVILAHPRPGSFNHAIADVLYQRSASPDTGSHSMTCTRKNSIPCYPMTRSPAMRIFLLWSQNTAVRLWQRMAL
jgi:hypothetical protein